MKQNSSCLGVNTAIFLAHVIKQNHHHVLFATNNRFDPKCEPHLDEILNQESIHSS